jgi:hypothetical protein
MLRCLDDLADEHLDEITAPGLLSWLPVKGKEPRPTGLLARNPGRVFATVGDLSTLLASSDRGSRDQLYSLLRRAYDGRVVREVGNAPRALKWNGRLTLLAAVTPTVDNYASHSDALGPRWLYLRLAPATAQLRREASRKAREGGLKLADHRERVRATATALVKAATPRAATAHVGELLGEKIDDAATVTCVGRADVPRNGYGRREIVGHATIEEPPRIAGQLEKLALALLALGLTEHDTAALCRRAALDSMPLARRSALAALANAGGEPLTQAEIARRAHCDRSVARFALEELAAIGVANYLGANSDDEEQRRGPWHLCGEYAGLVQAVFTAPVATAPDVAKSGKHPPDPPEDGGSTPHFATSREHAGEAA